MNDLNALTEKVELMKKEIALRIRTLPTNPSIKECGTGFTINISQLSDDLKLDPRYYDFRCQYEAIAKIVEKTPVEKLHGKLSGIIQTRRIDNHTRMHPDVARHLWKML